MPFAFSRKFVILLRELGHGVDGVRDKVPHLEDETAAVIARLNPPPADLRNANSLNLKTDKARAKVIREGHEGTGMFPDTALTDQEIADGINAGIAAFNLESEEEIENVDRVAGSIGKKAIGAIRINPDVDPKTHAKTTTGKKETKFGVDIERAERVFEQYRKLKNLRIGGIHIHIGSPVYEIQPYVDAVEKVGGKPYSSSR